MYTKIPQIPKKYLLRHLVHDLNRSSVKFNLNYLTNPRKIL